MLKENSDSLLTCRISLYDYFPSPASFIFTHTYFRQLYSRMLNIDDITKSDLALLYTSKGKIFEEKFGFHIKSILTLPLKNMEGETVGLFTVDELWDDKDFAVLYPANTWGIT